MKIDNFFAELKRRNVYKVAVAYVVAGWALSQGIAQVFPVFDVPNWVIRLIVVLIILGFPVAVVFAWAFETHTRRNQANRKLPMRCRRQLDTRNTHWIYVVVIGAILSITLFFLGRYSAVNGAPRHSEAATEMTQKSIAVLAIRKSERRQEHRLLQ